AVVGQRSGGRRSPRARPDVPSPDRSGTCQQEQLLPHTPALRLTGVRKTFGSTVAVRDVNLEVERGQIVGMLGPSGCGKTTVLRCIAGLERPDTGMIEINGAVVTGPG